MRAFTTFIAEEYGPQPTSVYRSYVLRVLKSATVPLEPFAIHKAMKRLGFTALRTPAGAYEDMYVGIDKALQELEREGKVRSVEGPYGGWLYSLITEGAVHESTASLTLSTKSDATRAKALRTGERVTIDGYTGEVKKVSVTKRSRTEFHPTDPTSTWQRQVSYEVVTVTLVNDWLQQSKHTFATS